MRVLLHDVSFVDLKLLYALLLFRRALGTYYLLCYFLVMYCRRGADLLLMDWYIEGWVS